MDALLANYFVQASVLPEKCCSRLGGVHFGQKSIGKVDTAWLVRTACAVEKDSKNLARPAWLVRATGVARPEMRVSPRRGAFFKQK